MVPDFRYLIERLRELPRVKTIIDRCNLTILLEPGYEWLTDFLIAHRLKIVASMPCYAPENVNAQRGDGVFDASIRALQLLNRLGCGRQDDLSSILSITLMARFYRLTRPSSNLTISTN
jgi:hypothetical protein